jgi:hypothetical protein
MAILQEAYRRQQRVVRYREHQADTGAGDNYFTAKEMEMASVVWHLTGEKQSAMDFLEHKWSARPRHNKSMHTFFSARIQADLQQAYCYCPEEVLQDIFFEVDGSRHWSVANFLAEQCVFQWLLETNTKGLAPPALQCLEQWVISFPPLSKGERYMEFLQDMMKDEGQRGNWIRSYRKRWGFQYRRLPLQPPLSREQIAQKARKIHYWIEDILCQQCAPFVPHVWAPPCCDMGASLWSYCHMFTFTA